MYIQNGKLDKTKIIKSKRESFKSQAPRSQKHASNLAHFAFIFCRIINKMQPILC